MLRLVSERYSQTLSVIDIDLGRRMLRIEVPVDTDKVRLVSLILSILWLNGTSNGA